MIKFPVPQDQLDITGAYDLGPGFIRTYSGIAINVIDPEPDQIDIRDIAHSLSMQPRFAGHLPRLYSVAQHSIEVSNYVSPENRLAGLLHDAAEAYLLDIPSPIKPFISNYKQIEGKVMKAIAEKFGFAWPLDPEIKIVDKYMVEYEWHCIVRHQGKLFHYDSEEAEHRFLGRFNFLTRNK